MGIDLKEKLALVFICDLCLPLEGWGLKCSTVIYQTSMETQVTGVTCTEFVLLFPWPQRLLFTLSLWNLELFIPKFVDYDGVWYPVDVYLSIVIANIHVISLSSSMNALFLHKFGRPIYIWMHVIYS